VIVIATMESEWLFGRDIFEFMKLVQNSDDKEETDSLLLAASKSDKRRIATACRRETPTLPPTIVSTLAPVISLRH